MQGRDCFAGCPSREVLAMTGEAGPLMRPARVGRTRAGTPAPRAENGGCGWRSLMNGGNQ